MGEQYCCTVRDACCLQTRLVFYIPVFPERNFEVKKDNTRFRPKNSHTDSTTACNMSGGCWSCVDDSIPLLKPHPWLTLFGEKCCHGY